MDTNNFHMENALIEAFPSFTHIAGKISANTLQQRAGNQTSNHFFQNYFTHIHLKLIN